MNYFTVVAFCKWHNGKRIQGIWFFLSGKKQSLINIFSCLFDLTNLQGENDQFYILSDSCYCRRAPRIVRHAQCWGFWEGCCQPDVAHVSLRQVYLSLLRMYLSPPSIHCLGPIKLELLEPKANLQAALQVLELHHSKLDTTKVRSCS